MVFDTQDLVTAPLAQISIHQQHSAAGLRKGQRYVKRGNSLSLIFDRTSEEEALWCLARLGKQQRGADRMVNLARSRAALGLNDDRCVAAVLGGNLLWSFSLFLKRPTSIAVAIAIAGVRQFFKIRH